MSKFLFRLLFRFTVAMCTIGGMNLGQSWAGSEDYSKLQMLNLDEMKAYVDQRLTEAQTHIDAEEINEATENLRNALNYILSRPNGDNMVSQLMPPVRSKLKDLEVFEDTVASVTDQAIFALTDGKETPSKKATNLIVLENVLSEFKPDVKNNKQLEKIFAKIRDAKIKIPKEVESDLRLRGMFKPKASPSQTAEKIIGKAPKD